MTTETIISITNTPFLKELVRQIRAQDSMGVYRSWSDELILKPLILTKEQKRKISVEGDVEPITQLRITAFYRAIATLVEQETGLLCQVVINLSHEGFGWALVFSGHLLVVSKTLRDAQRFGYESMEKLAAEGEKLTKSAVELATKYREVTNA
ncbi:NifX-associated nitrogen fixation protein [Planktothrix sp. FACHB-1365]|uniref:NifX-associated nitrogen fixation protein n=1 Tax=Planktothrix sp. FACHB-1365 TaxID=2692855 RepID=UPI001682BCDB|nr:NifX-associated nitrogen fixation protein [Planktothrix sp. FACHB-1365]MBD2484716.1 NifX-associated nitrogen fixation protein [Planktothrix sp. FACHB-1365]